MYKSEYVIIAIVCITLWQIFFTSVMGWICFQNYWVSICISDQNVSKNSLCTMIITLHMIIISIAGISSDVLMMRLLKDMRRSKGLASGSQLVPWKTTGGHDYRYRLLLIKTSKAYHTYVMNEFLTDSCLR